MNDVPFLQAASIFSPLPALVLGFFALASRNWVSSAFFFFVLLGFLTDISMFLPESLNMLRHGIYNFYCLIECLFLLWFLKQFIEHRILKKLVSYLFYLVLPFWILCYLVLKNAFLGIGAMSPIFDTLCLMVISLFAAYVLLMKTQGGYHARNEAAFWFTIGIFFFSFCSFFLLAFVEEEVAEQIWYLQNIINIITMILYAIGFGVALRQNVRHQAQKNPAP